MEILLSLAYAAVFIFIIRRSGFYRLVGLKAHAVPLLFVLKVLAGVSLGLVYTYHYTDRLSADTFRLFDDSSIVYGTLQTHPADFFRIMTGIGGGAEHLEVIYNSMHNWYDVYSPVNDNRFMIRLNTILRFFSFGHYYVHVVFIAFLSTTGTVALLRFTESQLQGCSKLLFLLIGFLPSVLFWGSGLMKDAVVVFSLGFTLYFFGKSVAPEGKSKHYVLLLFFLVLLTFTRFQVLVITLPGLVAWLVAVRSPKKPVIIFPIVFAFFLFTIALLTYSIPDADLPKLLYQKQQSFLKLATDAEAGSIITPLTFQPEFSSVLLYAPLGFLNAFTRPFLTDVGNPLIAVSAIENILIILFGIYSLLHSRGSNPFSKSIFLFCISFVLISYSLIGLVTPVLGAIVRYKTPALPLLMILFILLMSKQKREQLNLIAGKLPI